MERQNLEGKTVVRRATTSSTSKKKKSGAPKRGRNAVADKRKAPKTGSNRRQGSKK
jgi:ATP-dependent RNA helicase DeaD